MSINNKTLEICLSPVGFTGQFIKYLFVEGEHCDNIYTPEE